MKNTNDESINISYNSAKRGVRRSTSIGLRKKIEDTIEIKEAQLKAVFSAMESTKRKPMLNELDKVEIEIRAQLKILHHILS